MARPKQTIRRKQATQSSLSSTPANVSPVFSAKNSVRSETPLTSTCGNDDQDKDKDAPNGTQSISKSTRASTAAIKSVTKRPAVAANDRDDRDSPSNPEENGDKRYPKRRVISKQVYIELPSRTTSRTLPLQVCGHRGRLMSPELYIPHTEGCHVER
jgi:hypothetical protein